MKQLINQLYSFSLKRGSSLLFFCLTFLFFYLYAKRWIYLDIFTFRDIQRALGWLEGNPYWLGAEMSGGNHLPGPFFYFLLFPPLMAGGDIYSHSVLWYLSWLTLTYTAAFYFVSKITIHKESALIFLGIFSAVVGLTIHHPLHFAWNSGFAILFHVLSTVYLYYYRQTNKNIYLYVAGLVIALGVQIHLLVFAHIITAILLYFLNNTNDKKTVTITLFLLIALSPFLSIKIAEHFHFLEVSPTSYRNYLMFLKNDLFGKKWIKTIKAMFHFTYIIPLILYVFLTIQKKRNKAKQIISKSTLDLFVIIMIPICIALPLASRDWYTYFIPILLMIFLSKCCDDLIPEQPAKKNRILFILLFIWIFTRSGSWTAFHPLEHWDTLKNNYHYFLLFSALLILIILTQLSKKNLWTIGVICSLFFTGYMKIIGLTLWQQKYYIPKSFSRLWPSYQELKPLMQRIFLDTNWSSKEAAKRIYSIGLWLEVSVLMNYSLAKEDALNAKSLLEKREIQNSPDGYIMILHLKEFTDYSKKNWQQHLSQSSLLSDFLRQEIRSGKILMDNPQLYGLFWLIPYKTTKKSVFTAGFYNVGQPYYWEEPKWFKHCITTQSYENKGGLYYCMVLPGPLNKAGIHINFYESKNKINSPFPHGFDQTFMNITFSGSLIGTSECSSNQGGYAAWSDIQMNISCNTEEIQYDLPNMGLNCDHQIEDARERGQFFSAPLKLKIPIKSLHNCKKEDIKKVELIFNHLFSKPYHIGDWTTEKIKIIWKRDKTGLSETL